MTDAEIAQTFAQDLNQKWSALETAKEKAPHKWQDKAHELLGALVAQTLLSYERFIESQANESGPSGMEPGPEQSPLEPFDDDSA